MEAQTVAQQPARRSGAGAPAGHRPRGLRERAARSPFLVATVACVALAAISAAVLPTVPSYDPWSWIVWGKEVTDPHLSFFVGGGPSWKPLPVMFTTVFGLFGGAAPTLWVIAARAGGLLGLVAGYRLAARLIGGPWWAAAAAGLIAIAGIVLTQDWVYYMFRGTTEPMLIGAWLWAIDRHLDGHRVTAFLLGVATGLMRPEAWPFVVVYAVWLWFNEPAFRGPWMRALLLAGLAALPFFWFVPPWISTGQPFLAATHAHEYNGHLGSNRLVEVLRRGVDLQTVAVLVLALVATGLAVVRRQRADDRAGGDRRRLVGSGRRGDTRRLSRSRALLPPRRGDRLRAGRSRRCSPGAAGGRDGPRRRARAATAAALGVAVAIVLRRTLCAVHHRPDLGRPSPGIDRVTGGHPAGPAVAPPSPLSAATAPCIRATRASRRSITRSRPHWPGSST